MSKDEQSLIAVIAIAELIAKYGVPITLQMITVWDIDDPTAEDWEDLKVQHPSTFLQP